MGAPASKFGQEIEQEEPTQGSLPSTPILTPKARLLDIDPRSPSENIARTPIESLFPKNKDATVDTNESLPLQNDCDTFSIYSPGVKFKNIDPRSPTIEFIRTPIVVPQNDTLPLRLHNKNLDNVRKTLMQSPLAKLIETKLAEKVTPPKLLESNVISSRQTENKRKSYVGLLETNLDYVETDLDNVKKLDANLDKKSEVEYRNSVESDCDSDVDIDKRTPLADVKFLTPTQNKTLLPSDVHGKSNKDVCINNIDPRSPTTDFIRTPIQILETLENIEIKDNSVEVQNYVAEICTDSDDDGLRTSHKTLTTPKNANKHSASSERQLNVANIKDFDKKLSNLIYEDKEDTLQCVIRNRKVTEQKSRTPLGTRNLNANPKKGISKLKVHDKPQKGGKEFSKIPIFQNKKGKGKFITQCENTPPPNMEDTKKLDKHKWDPDSTFII